MHINLHILKFQLVEIVLKGKPVGPFRNVNAALWARSPLSVTALLALVLADFTTQETIVTGASLAGTATPGASNVSVMWLVHRTVRMECVGVRRMADVLVR